tara:strand:- start:2306 stop:3046 length:741 start_codon:yes stop_codon:yes gene_type:complete
VKLKQILQESNRDAFERSLTREDKRDIMDSVSKFNEFGSKIYKTNEIAEMVEAIRNMTSGASKLALQETDGWFDGVTVKRDMKEVANSTKLFEKAAKELSTLQQRLESVFEDIGHKLGKYYNINEAMDAVGKEDDDIDNDGDSDESDEYLAKKRSAISKAVSEGRLDEASKPIDKKLVKDWEKMVNFLQDKMEEYKKNPNIKKDNMLYGMANGAYNNMNTVRGIPGQWLKIQKMIGEGKLRSRGDK